MKTYVSTVLFVCITVVTPSDAELLPKNTTSIRTWQTMQFDGIQRQKYDYSCGAAALATLSNLLFEDNYEEQDILTLAGVENAMTLSDLLTTADLMGRSAQAIYTNIDTMLTLTQPLIVHLRPVLDPGPDHYSVIVGIDKERVMLADSNWGRRTISLAYFKAMWLIHRDSNDNPVGIIFSLNSPDKLYGLMSQPVNIVDNVLLGRSSLLITR